MSKGSRNRSANKAYWSSSYWDKPASRDAKPASDGGEAVKEIKRLVGEQCKARYIWRCMCSGGYCDFDTKADAMDNGRSQFCGARATVKRRKVK